MRGPRLTRSKTSDASPATCHDSQTNTPVALQTSFDDLRSPDGRQKLREQLSSQFPESYASPLKSSPSATTDMAGRQWLSVGQNAAAKSSSSSVDSTSHGPKRLSAVPERDAALDVEQAIHLLTELKKTASPDQLVALHKALLPTRDSIISTADSSAGQRASLIRQKSMLPAGLATRGGAADDLLKRQEDVEPVITEKKKSKSGRSEGNHRLQSKSSIAALDLADDTANPLSTGPRAATPSDQQQYFGAYRPGTLRITNGAASPEPSLRPRTSGDSAAPVTLPELAVAARNRSGSESRPSIETAIEVPKQRIHAAMMEAAAASPVSKSQGPAQSRQYKSQRSQEPLQSNTPLARSREPSLSRPPVTRSRDPSLSRAPLNVETKASKQSLGASKKPSTDSFLRRSLDTARPSMESIRRSIDDGRVSPIDVPRFAQRWSHRASQISQEYAADCEVPISPFEDRQSVSAFAQRLSTVYDREDAENTANETPETALSKLEGNDASGEQHSNLDETPSGQFRSGNNVDRHSDEHNSLRATATGLNAIRPHPVSHHSEPRPATKKADSGYVSDASRRSVQAQTSNDPGANISESPVAYEYSQPGYKEIVHRTESQKDEIQSLYTLEQILKMPSLLPNQNAPPRPEAGRKHSSLLRLTGLKKSSFAASRATLDANSSADSLPLPTPESAPSSPAESKAIKSVKKLQKRMPEDMRRQRREQREKEKTSLALAGPQFDTMNTTADLSELASSPVPGPVSQLDSPSTMTLSSSPLAARKYRTPTEALNELLGDNQHPAELDTDESTSAPKQSLSRKQSKRSRRRSRQNTVTAADGEEKPEASKRRSFSLGRKRSKSKRRSGSLTPKRRSQEPAVPSIATLSATWDENGSQESLPLYSDYGSVARSLGGNPYDISTGMFNKGSKDPGTDLDQLQSPHQISTSYNHSTGLRGMNSQTASELARLKSRDVAIQNNEQLYDRPRMATPKRSQTDVSRYRNTMPNAVMVEQRQPGWAAKPVLRNNSLDSLESSSGQRPYSIAESIPSLPELPVDAESRSTKAAEYLARRHREMQVSSVLAESPSPPTSSNLTSTEQPGFSNESVADAVAKAVEARRAKQAIRVEDGQKADRLRRVEPSRMSSDASSSTGQVSLQLHGLDERPYSDASASILIGVGSERGAEEERPRPTATNNDEPEMSIWERQAQMWRSKRESIGETLGKPVEEDAVTDPEQTPVFPPVVASQQASPSARDSLPSRRRKSASEHANAYRDLIGNDGDSFDEPLPRNPNRTSAQSTSTVTGRPSPDTIVVETAQTAKMYQATPIQRERSAGGRVRTPSGSYVPYSPTFASQAERSRASIEGQDAPRQTESLDVQRRAYHHEQKNNLKSTLGRYDPTLSPVPASDAGSIAEPRERLRTGASREPNVPTHQFDRYGGGLQYGYERGRGVQGSSGLRTGAEAGKAREGNRFSEQFGLDFGDVPVFLRKAR